MMSRTGPPKSAKPPSKCVATGGYGDVWLFGDALADWNDLCSKKDKFSQQATARLSGLFRRFSERGMEGFVPEMFKSVERIKADGGNEHMLYEFKGHHVRIYGVVRRYLGRSSFLGTAADPAKKTRKADRRILKRAANAADGIDGD